MKQTDDRSRRCFLKASSMLGVAVAFGPATIGEAFADSKTTPQENTMTRTSATQAAGQAADECDSSVSGECSGSGTYRIAQAHQRDKVA